jgi:monothiol glutaredoxin
MMLWILVALSLLSVSLAFRPAAPRALCARAGDGKKMQVLMSSNALDDSTRAFLDKVIKDNKVVLFMKGNALFPQCGFSNTAVRILDAVGTKFETVNVLDSDKIRNGIKVYSSWPTIPQLYVGGEFVGGSDIMIELYNNGQLAEMVELANAQ